MGLGQHLRVVGISLATSLLLVGTAFADSEIRTFLDLDHDPATGCAVATPSGVFPGAEEVVTTTLSAGALPQVTGVGRQVCVTGSLERDPLSDAGGWAVGLNLGEGGFSVVETYAPLDHPNMPPLRLGVAVRDLVSGGEDDLLTTDGRSGGAPIDVVVTAIPALGPTTLALLALVLAASAMRVVRRGGAGCAGLASLALISRGSTLRYRQRDRHPARFRRRLADEVRRLLRRPA